MPLDDSLFRFSLLMLFVPMLVGGGAGLFATFHGLKRRRAMEKWPPVHARVMETEVRDGEYRGVLGSKEMAWDLVVDYEYEAGGRAYTGQVSLEVAVPRSRKSVAQSEVDEAVDNAKEALTRGLVVHVNPAAPTQSMLPVETSGWAYFRLVLFGSCVAVSVLALAFVFTA